MTEEKWSLVRETLKKGRLSVIMPIFNLEESVVENIKKTAELFDKNAIRTEIIPVDDGSVDETAQRLSSLKGLSFNTVSIQPVFLKMNGGKGAALRAGFAASSGDFVLLLDGDLDINPKQTAEFFFEMSRHNADVVVGSKRHKRSLVQYPWHRRIVSWVYFSLVRFFVGLKLTDTQTGMKLFKRDVLEEALSRMLVKTYAFDLELLSIAASRGAKIVEAPVVIRFGDKFGALKLKTVYQMAKDSAAVFYRLKVLKYYASSRAPRKLEYTPMISIVIACPNRSWMLDECLAALQCQTYREFEVIVLPDGEWSPSGNYGYPLSVIPTGKVRPAEKRNVGIAKSKGSIVAFIDDDAYPEQLPLTGVAVTRPVVPGPDCPRQLNDQGDTDRQQARGRDARLTGDRGDPTVSRLPRKPRSADRSARRRRSRRQTGSRRRGRCLTVPGWRRP
jgi:glycosyltransferase involved in cell wall biosynthesis